MSGTKLFWALLSLAVGAVFLYEQNDYILTTERAIITSYNKDYIIISTRFFKFNRTYTALNFTFDLRRELIGNVMGDIQGYRFASNEYRLFPIVFTIDVQKTLDTNEFGSQNLYNCGNLTGFPIKKGHYKICNWGPDYSKFPPHCPHGQYRFDIDFKHFSAKLFSIEWYVKDVSTGLF